MIILHYMNKVEWEKERGLGVMLGIRIRRRETRLQSSLEFGSHARAMFFKGAYAIYGERLTYSQNLCSRREHYNWPLINDYGEIF